MCPGKCYLLECQDNSRPYYEQHKNPNQYDSVLYSYFVPILLHFYYSFVNQKNKFVVKSYFKC